MLGARFQRSRFAPCKSVEPVWVEGSNPSRESLRSTLFRRGRLVFGFLRLAEREGFEPSIRETRIPDFESGAFDHSATSPQITTTGVGQFPSGASVRLIHETHPSHCSGPAIRLSKFAPGELVDHSATSPLNTVAGGRAVAVRRIFRLIPETRPSLLGAGIAGCPWSHGTSLPVTGPPQQGCCVLRHGGRVMIRGGRGNDKLRVFMPVANPGMPQPRMRPRRLSASCGPGSAMSLRAVSTWPQVFQSRTPRTRPSSR